MPCVASEVGGKMVVILYFEFSESNIPVSPIKMTLSCAVPPMSPFWPKASLKHLLLCVLEHVLHRVQQAIIRAPLHQASRRRATLHSTFPAASSLQTRTLHKQIWSRPAAPQRLLGKPPWKKYLHVFLPSWLFWKLLSRFNIVKFNGCC